MKNMAESQEKPNYKATAQEFNIGRTALSRRHQGKTTSRATANSKYRQLLTNAQEQQLINQINRLSVRHMPPTSQIVRNMAEITRGYYEWLRRGFFAQLFFWGGSPGDKRVLKYLYNILLQNITLQQLATP